MVVESIVGAVGGITNLIGAKQQRKAAAQENRNQVLQMVMASKMQNQQMQNQQIPPNDNKTNKNTTYLILGGIGFTIVVLIFILVWRK